MAVARGVLQGHADLGDVGLLVGLHLEHALEHADALVLFRGELEGVDGGAGGVFRFVAEEGHESSHGHARGVHHVGPPRFPLGVEVVVEQAFLAVAGLDRNLEQLEGEGVGLDNLGKHVEGQGVFTEAGRDVAQAEHGGQAGEAVGGGQS